MLLWFRFKLPERDQLQTAENRFQCKKKVKTLRFSTKTGKHIHLSAEKSVNYQRKAKMFLWFTFKLKQRDSPPTAENRFQCEKR